VRLEAEEGGDVGVIEGIGFSIRDHPSYRAGRAGKVGNSPPVVRGWTLAER
jgi:hypothetical protein